MIDKVEINTLLDYYGNLLTEKQQKICDLYFREDYSYQEISESEGVSRAAVYDTVKRCCEELHHYEEVLHEVNDDINRMQIVHQIRKLTQDTEILYLLDKLENTEN